MEEERQDWQSRADRFDLYLVRLSALFNPISRFIAVGVISGFGVSVIINTWILNWTAGDGLVYEENGTLSKVKNALVGKIRLIISQIL